MKKLFALLLALVMVCSFAACGGNGNASEPPADDNQGGESSGLDAKSVAVFYYDFGDTYISSVRSALDKLLGDAAQNYDAAGNQTTQTEQVQTAITAGAKALVVNVVDTGSNDAAQTILDMGKEAGIPVIFFNRSVEESVVSGYDKAVFVGTDYEMAGHMEGEMVGNYVLEHYDDIDLNGDGVIQYVMFKGQEGNMEAEARTKYGVEDADAILTAGGKEALEFYDAANTKKYLVDQNGRWSAAAATDYMNTILAQYSEANNNMVELIIANNDEMALGAIAGLQTANYNVIDEESGKVADGTTVIPVFGVDATDAAKEQIAAGTMVGSIKQDAEGMAAAINTITNNLVSGADKFADVDTNNVVGTWRVNIPYAEYKG